jgi:hypothetical protein
MPMQQAQMPMQQAQMPMQQAQMPMQQAQMPMQQAPIQQPGYQMQEPQSAPFDFDAPKIIRSQGKMSVVEALSQLSMRVTVLENLVQQHQQKDFDLNSDSTMSTLISTIVSRLDKLDKNSPSNVSDLLFDMQHEVNTVKGLISVLQQQQQTPSTETNILDIADTNNGKEEDGDEYIDVHENNMNINNNNRDVSNNSAHDFSPSTFMSFGR